VWKLEIEKLNLIHAAIEKEKARVESELAARAFFAVRIRESHLYIVYLKGKKAGPYSIREPYLWPSHDKDPFLFILQTASQQPAAQKIAVRALLAGKDRSGSLVFPAGRFDLLLAHRIYTPLPKNHPALRANAKKAKSAPPVIFYEETE
jgi:hypothetical protein